MAIFGSMAPLPPGDPAFDEIEAQMAREAAAEAMRRSVRQRKEGPITKVMEHVGQIPMRMVGAVGGAIDRAKQATDERFPAQAAAPIEISTDYAPFSLAADLGAETALNLMGLPALTGPVAGPSLASGAKRRTPPEVFGSMAPSGIRAYHGSTSLDGAFRPYGKELGPHFGTLDQATDRIMTSRDPWNKKDTFKDGARVMPVEINVRRPLEMRDITYWEPANVLNEFGKITDDAGKRIFAPNELAPVWSNYRKWKKSAFLVDERDPAIRDVMLDQIRDVAASKGFDAIKYVNLWEGKTGKTSNVAYIPLERGTVKSAVSGQPLYGLGALGGAVFGSIAPGEDQ